MSARDLRALDLEPIGRRLKAMAPGRQYVVLVLGEEGFQYVSNMERKGVVEALQTCAVFIDQKRRQAELPAGPKLCAKLIGDGTAGLAPICGRPLGHRGDCRPRL